MNRENFAMSRKTLDRASELLEAEHRQRMEYARIEHERRMEAIEAERAYFDERCRQLAEQITPSNARLDRLVGMFKAPPGAFDEEEPCY
jgi:hypoxanthine phosphoribosyltransferase